MAERFRIICYISIHAPAKGATGTARSRSAMTSHFNPRSREGSDPPKPDCLLASKYFNPRSREGSDRGKPAAREHGEISIHAPVKGATDFGSIAFQP